MAKSRLELQLEFKKCKLAITRAHTAKEEIDMKVLEAEVTVERLKNHQLLQDKAIADKTEELKGIDEQIKNFSD